MNVYLAAADGGYKSAILAALRYPFRLASYHTLTTINPTERDLALRLIDDGCAAIMDSGLFTYLFGAKAGALRDYADVRDYAVRYVAQLREWNWKHEIVECDAQMLIGTADTQRIRDEVFAGSGFDVIYVWHTPEGVDGLRALARTHARVAISVPELRKKLRGRDTGMRGAVLALLRTARDAGPAKVHLLGCTEAGMLEYPAHTCDSSSWLYAATYNKCTLFSGGRFAQVANRDPAWHRWCAAVRAAHPEKFARLDAWFAANPRTIHPLTARDLAASALAYWTAMDRAKQRDTAMEAATDG